MKKADKTSSTEVRKDVAPAEVSHFKNGHKWLANITGISAIWVLITFIMGLCGDADIARSLNYMNIWYLANMGIIGIIFVYATFAILSKSVSQIFWGGSSMYLLVLQAISLVIYFFYQQDSPAINAIAMFVWGICWYGYMLLSPAVESDLPQAYRTHSKAAEIIIGIMTVSTVGYGIMMAINLLW